MLRKFENIFIGPSSTWTGWTHIEHLLNACECAWTPMSEWEQPLNIPWVCMNANEWVRTAPEHLLSAHECNLVSVNTHWVCMNAIEWVWTPIERAWVPLSHYWTWFTMVWPWERSHLCQNWTVPEHLWVCVNAFEWVLNAPWMLVSAHERQRVSRDSPWTPIECAWTPLSKYLEGLNAHL
jgi:hypothetical protein